MSFDRLKSLSQYPLPHHLISRLVFHLTRLPHPLTRQLITWFVKQFDVILSEANEPDPSSYRTFNAFFTRELSADARPLSENTSAYVWPADGKISAFGNTTDGQLIQAKGHTYSVASLLADDTLSQHYQSGSFATVYLSPRDYHRVHIPATGTLQHMTHVPGRLFSVAPHTVENVPAVFARNERVIAHFHTAEGWMAVVWVGALNVGAIETVWHGLVTPEPGARIPGLIALNRWRKGLGATHWRYLKASDQRPAESQQANDAQTDYQRGSEIGRFNMGSTVIVLTESPLTFAPDTKKEAAVQMGQAMGSIE